MEQYAILYNNSIGKFAIPIIIIILWDNSLEKYAVYYYRVTYVVPRDLTSIAPLGTSAGRHPCRNAWRHFSMALHSSSRLFYCPSIFSLTSAPPSSALVNGVSALPYLCGDILSQCYTVVASAPRFAPGDCHVALCIFFTVLGTADAQVSSCSAHITLAVCGETAT